MTRTQFRIDFDSKKHLYIILSILFVFFAGFINGLIEDYREYQKTDDSAYINGAIFFIIMVGIPLMAGIGLTIRKLMLLGIIRLAEVKLTKSDIYPGERVPFEININVHKFTQAEAITLTVQSFIREKYLDRTGLSTTKDKETHTETYTLGENLTIAKNFPFKNSGELVIPQEAVPSGLVKETFAKETFGGITKPLSVSSDKISKARSASSSTQLIAVWQYRLDVKMPGRPDYKLTEEFKVQSRKD